MHEAGMTAEPNPNQSREKVIERFNAWPRWKREAFTYRKPEKGEQC